MKFIVVEYTYFDVESKVMYGLFDFENDQVDAQRFCEDVKKNGGAVNLRIREIDTNLLT